MRRWARAFLALLLAGLPVGAAGEPLKLMIPASPGGGWDTTARAVLAALDTSGLHRAAGVQVVNQGGAGGTAGLIEFARTMRGSDRAMMIMGATLVGAIYTNRSPVTLDQVAPLARLTTEHSALAVASSSPFKTLKDLTDALRADPAKVPVGGGVVGGVDHVTLALIGRAIGAPMAKLSFVSYQGGAQVGAAVSGKVAAAIAGAWEVKPYADTGRLRVLAVMSGTRIPGVNAPTLKESGIDVVISNWRGLVGPPGMSPAGRAALIDLLDRMHVSKPWQETLKSQSWDDAYLSGDAFGAFLKDENGRIGAVLREVGLVK